MSAPSTPLAATYPTELFQKKLEACDMPIFLPRDKCSTLSSVLKHPAESIDGFDVKGNNEMSEGRVSSLMFPTSSSTKKTEMSSNDAGSTCNKIQFHPELTPRGAAFMSSKPIFTEGEKKMIGFSTPKYSKKNRSTKYDRPRASRVMLPVGKLQARHDMLHISTREFSFPSRLKGIVEKNGTDDGCATKQSWLGCTKVLHVSLLPSAGCPRGHIIIPTKSVAIRDESLLQRTRHEEDTEKDHVHAPIFSGSSLSRNNYRRFRHELRVSEWSDENRIPLMSSSLLLPSLE